MKTLEEYHKEVKQNAIAYWTKGDYTAFKNMEKDPVVNLMLSALSYQAFHLQRRIKQYEEKTLKDFRDRIIPFHLIKPTPAFSIVEAKMLKTFDKAVINEDSIFEFKKYKFSPLLETHIINAELKIVSQHEKSVWVELESVNPIKDLYGMSIYIDTNDIIDIASIKCGDYKLPLIKPSQYNELPFTKMFNNAHLFQDQNYYLYGSYDYWQELFLTNTSNLFYIGQYDIKDIFLSETENIQLEIVFNSPVDVNDIKINCIPVVNVEQKEAVLNEKNPVQELSSDGEFLNLLYDNESGKNADSFLIRQHGIERYNPKQLLEQIQEMVYHYVADYYAFQSIDELKNGDKIRKMQEVLDEMSDIAANFEEDSQKEHYYAVLKKHKDGNEKVDLKYLVTYGKAANGIRKSEKAIKAPNCIERNKTVLLLDTKSGRNSIKDENRKENIAKYYFLTKDRLVTATDIRLFIKTFYYTENDEAKLLDSDIENIGIERKNGYIEITITLLEDSELKNTDKAQSLAATLQKNIELRSSNTIPFIVRIS
jgi:hypothetical protein